jgi:hypothetical protein
MVPDCRIKQIEHHDLLTFLKNIVSSDMQYQLLCFWGRHPRAKLSFYAVSCALDIAEATLRDAVTVMVEKRVLVTDQNNSLTTYALSRAPQVQRYIRELANLAWLEKINLRRHLNKSTLTDV